MDIFDTIFEKAKDVYDIASKKTGEMVEISKIKLDCVKINNEIKKLYEKLGCSVYSMLKSDYENQDVIDSIAEEIDDKLKKLAYLNGKLNEMRNVIICSACGTKNPEENFYCCKCGSRIKTEFDTYAAYESAEEPEAPEAPPSSNQQQENNAE